MIVIAFIILEDMQLICIKYNQVSFTVSVILRPIHLLSIQMRCN